MSAFQLLSASQAATGHLGSNGRARRRKAFRSAALPISEKAGPGGAMGADWELIQQAIRGDSEAQRSLFATHTPRLYRVAFKVLRNKEDAEDVVQDSWCRAFCKLSSFEGRSSLATWLTRIVLNSALMLRRKNTRYAQVSLNDLSTIAGDELVHQLFDHNPNPEEACGKVEIDRLVMRQLARLSPRMQTVFVLCDVEGFSTPEAVKLLGIKTSAVKSRLVRARRKLAQGLQSIRVSHASSRLSMSADSV